MQTKIILVVEDNEINQELLEEQLLKAGYQTNLAGDGEQALQLLRAAPDRYAMVLLDWMMPKMDGMAVLQAMRQEKLLAHIPVVMQSAKAYDSDIIQGYIAGASNYLTKPFAEEKLLAIVSATLKEFEKQQRLLNEVRTAQRPLRLMQSGFYTFQTLDQVAELAAHIAHSSQHPEQIVSGLNELMINAIEHGNLGISYQEKTKLILSDTLQSEIKLRLVDPKYVNKVASLTFNRTKSELHFLIKDQGDGFGWEEYMDIDPLRINDPHGRGIAMSNKTSFTSMEYRGKGNEVLAIFDEDRVEK